MNHHKRQSCEKQMWLQAMSAATGCSKESCLLGCSLVGRAHCNGRRGRGRGNLSRERRLVTLNLAILIIGESRRCSTLVAVPNCTMEVKQEHFENGTVNISQCLCTRHEYR